MMSDIVVTPDNGYHEMQYMKTPTAFENAFKEAVEQAKLKEEDLKDGKESRQQRP